jgi:hypothetical protein
MDSVTITGICERCPEKAHGRFCDTHRREHGQHLSAQLDAIVADHRRKVIEAREQSAARIPETCGHDPSDLRVEDHIHFCGRCDDEATR